MARANDTPIFNEATGGTIALTTSVSQGPDVAAQLARFGMAAASETITVTLGCSTAGTGGIIMTGGSPPVPFLIDNLSRISMKASGNVTINFTVER